MSPTFRPRFRALLLALVSASAGAPAAIASQTAPQPATPAAMEAIYEARADSARMLFSEADVSFVTSMIHHHAQAITMAEMAPTHGADPTIRTLAARIINGQSAEIATMQRWLAERGRSVPVVTRGVAGDPVPAAEGADRGRAPPAEVATPPMDPAVHEQHTAGGGVTADPHAGMPGMLSPAQIAQLDASRGPAFDQLFLALMIEHHRGAVTMVEDLFATDGALQGEALFKLASDVLADQNTEIDRMTGMLIEATGSPLAPALLQVR